MELDPTGVAHEVDFWRGFVRSERFRGWVADCPTPELDKRVLWLLRGLHALGLVRSVLDVGSGPVSILNGAAPDLKITTADPLSVHYQTLFDYAAHNLEAPLPFAAEELPDAFRAAFDCVHISNALDHTVSPLVALQRLVECVRLGGLLIVQGHANEADHEGRSGFHQHNLDLIGDCLTINGEDVTPESLDCSAVCWDASANMVGRRWYVWVLRKGAA